MSAMIRNRENPFALRAGALSLLVHGLMLALLVVSFSWHNVTQPIQISEVELWDSIPPQKVAPTLETPKPEPVLPKVEPEPEPPPPPPPPEPKAEIQVKAKPPVEVKPPPKPKPEKKPESKPEVKPEIKPKPDPKLKAKEELKRLQQLMAEEDQQLQKEVLQKDAQQAADARNAAEASRSAAAAQAASSGIVDKYKAQIQAKIKRYVNKQVCGTGKPSLEFGIALMPTGEVSGNPRLTRSSGITACDQAVERAILQAQPLPLPPQPELFSQFRDLNLQFRPNEE